MLSIPNHALLRMLGPGRRVPRRRNSSPGRRNSPAHNIGSLEVCPMQFRHIALWILADAPFAHQLPPEESNESDGISRAGRVFRAGCTNLELGARIASGLRYIPEGAWIGRGLTDLTLDLRSVRAGSCFQALSLLSGGSRSYHLFRLPLCVASFHAGRRGSPA